MTDLLPVDQCSHRYLSPEIKCRTCGIQFNKLWHAATIPIWQPVFRILCFTGAALMMTAYAVGNEMGAIVGVFVAITVFTMTRLIMSLAERAVPRQFRVGIVEQVGNKSQFNILANKPFVGVVSRIKFQMNSEVLSAVEPGDLVLVEFLRWTRLPVVWSRGKKKR